MTADVKVPLSAPDDLDAAYSEVRKPPYDFTWSGRDWSMPHMMDQDYRVLARIEGYAELGVDELISLVADLLGKDQRQAWADVDVPTSVLYMLFDRYMKHCGAKAGEDEASSDSSGSTGKSSRRTSGGSTASASRSRSSAKKAAPEKQGAPRPIPRKTAAVKAASAAIQQSLE